MTRGTYGEPFRSRLKKRFAALASRRLNQNVEHDTILIDGAPEIVLHAADPDKDFVHVPLVPWPWPAASHVVGKALAEFLAPAPYGLVGDDDAPLGQKQFDVAQAEAEHVVQPHSMADDLRGEAVAVVRVGWRHHPSVSFIPTPAANPSYCGNAPHGNGPAPNR